MSATVTKATRFTPPAGIPRLAKSPGSERISIAPHRHLFEQCIPLLAVRGAAKDIGMLKGDALLKPSIFQSKSLASIAFDPTASENRLLLLNCDRQDALPVGTRRLIQGKGLEVVDYQLKLGYDYFTADEVLHALLPEDILDEMPSAFAMVGHIAHMNLRDDYLPFRHLIGEVVVDKNAAIQTVVNKLDVIDTTFRFFRMEVLAGRPDFNVTVSEAGCIFQFDFSKIYYNSRLSTEHARLVNLFPPSSLVLDAFAGVGPFAVPAAKKGCAVLASDLNPAAVDAMRWAVKKNNAEGRCRVSEGDGRKKIRDGIVEAWKMPFPGKFEGKKRPPKGTRTARLAAQAGTTVPSAVSATTLTSAEDDQPPRRLVDHVVMNLPDSALTFLDAFRGVSLPLASDQEYIYALEGGRRLPMVHCYCFTKETDNPEPDILARASEYLGHRISPEATMDYSLSLVRRVAPKKDMYRLSFRVPWAVAFAEGISSLQVP